jgi:hypothetical protein
MSTKLERNCRILLRFYPRAYRKLRGPELVATLADSTPPNRSFPTFANTSSLVTAGIRERIASSAGETPGEIRRWGAQSGSLVVLGLAIGSRIPGGASTNTPTIPGPRLLVLFLGLCLLSRTRNARSSIPVAVALATLGILWEPIPLSNRLVPNWHYPLLLLFATMSILPYVGRWTGRRRSLVLPVAVIFLTHMFGTSFAAGSLMIFLLVASTLGATVDPRWSFSASYLLTLQVLNLVSWLLLGRPEVSTLFVFQSVIIPFAVLLGFLACGTLGTRRYVRLRST